MSHLFEYAGFLGLLQFQQLKEEGPHAGLYSYNGRQM